jgi:hypothetical protein
MNARPSPALALIRVCLTEEAMCGRATGMDTFDHRVTGTLDGSPGMISLFTAVNLSGNGSRRRWCGGQWASTGP